MIRASPTAQRLVLAYKHFGRDPYELFNETRRIEVCPTCTRRREPDDVDAFCRGHELHEPAMWATIPVPPHPRPLFYRAFLLAAAQWVEDSTAATAVLGALGGVGRA